MSKILVIAEKPGAGMAIANVIGATARKEGYAEGGKYIVSWSFGHLAGLAEASDYGPELKKWRLGNLPIIPDEWQYKILGTGAKQFDVLRGLMKRADVTGLVCATDAGREGELIFRLIYRMAKCGKPVKRLWISSMEEEAIKKGFASLRDGRDHDALFHAALCRAKADWLIGINATRLFSVLYGGTLNVGRVQTPTLAMLVERQAQRDGFVKEKYHVAQIGFRDGFAALSGRLDGKPEADAVLAASVAAGSAHCVSLTRETKTAPPPRLFDLTALQRESNRLFGHTAQQTLDAAQKLYEARLITYPRTDSRHLTDDMRTKLPAIITAAAKYSNIAATPANVEQVINDAKVTDHHAIIPTMGMARPITAGLDVIDRDIMRLIATRLVCAVGDRHVYETVKAEFECGGHVFTAKGKTIMSQGWKSAARGMKTDEGKNKKEDGAEEETGELPPIGEGGAYAIDPDCCKIKERHTEPPKAHTEATLLSAMENAGAAETGKEAEKRGLGTPATRAATIEKLIKNGHVSRNGKNLAPTETGKNLIAVVPDKLKSPLLTAEWENGLALIAKGEADPADFMAAIEKMARDLVRENRVRDDRHRFNFARP